MAWYEVKKGGGSPSPSPAESFIYNFGITGFNTGHNHTANTKVRFKALLTDMYAPNAYGQAFGTRNQNRFNNAFGLFHRFNGQRRFCFYRTGYEIQGDVAGTTPTTSAPFSGEVCIFTAEGTSISWYAVDDPLTVRELSAPSAVVNAGICPLAIFCGNTSTQQDGWTPTDFGSMRLYWFEIFESGALVHRFVPAYNNDQYCLYDEVDDTYIYDVVSSGLYLSGTIGSVAPSGKAYIAANGQQIVTLPFYSDDCPIIKAKLMTCVPAGQQVFIGDIWDANGVIFYTENNDFNALYFRYSSSAVSTITNVKWCEPVNVEIDYNNGSIKYDGVLYSGSPKTQLHNSIKLFGQNATSRRSLVYIYEMQIYVNGALAMHLIPMKDTNTGAGYLHDTVGNQDYYSETSVPLIYGESA